MPKLTTKIPIFLSLFFGFPSISHAGAMDFLKGCLVMGGVGVGGTVVAASQSKVEIKNADVLAVSGVTSCLIGGFLAMDIAKKAEMEASQELRLKNEKLKHSVYNVMHDLCVMKRECGPDGIPYGESGGKDPAARPGDVKPISPIELRSGN